MVTVGDVAEDCAVRHNLPLIFDRDVAPGIVECRWKQGIFVHPDSMNITLKEQTARTLMFDPTRKSGA
jgi:hypothetical protein